MVLPLGQADIWASILQNEHVAQMVVATVLVVFLVTGHTIRAVVRTKQKTAIAEKIEETRRELAAYVAEGSMTTAEAERLLNAGSSSSHRDRCGDSHDGVKA